ncbi:MAG: hypothetical protein NTV01_11345, partial [Bacteroidia bacterium]|nr:hypothetical protein [Bacteroidia bacterium]
MISKPLITLFCHLSLSPLIKPEGLFPLRLIFPNLTTHGNDEKHESTPCSTLETSILPILFSLLINPG